MKTTIGLALAVFNKGGKILLIERERDDSIVNISYRGCLELPIMAARETNEDTIPCDYLARELIQGMLKKLGVEFPVSSLAAFYPVAFKTPTGEYDVAMITTLKLGVLKIPERIKAKWVSPKELEKLTAEFVPADGSEKGKGLLSGKGRQYRLALMAFMYGSSNSAFQEKAAKLLKDLK